MQQRPAPAAARAARKPATAALLAVLAAVLGCGGESGGADPSAAVGDGSAEAAEELARGEVLSFSCRPCHALARGDASPVGPSLHGMFGRPAAALEGFEYSAALRQSGITWSADTLDAWLANPETFLPGNDMEFAGFHSARDRRALIAYLELRTAIGRDAEGASD